MEKHQKARETMEAYMTQEIQDMVVEGYLNANEADEAIQDLKGLDYFTLAKTYGAWRDK